MDDSAIQTGVKRTWRDKLRTNFRIFMVCILLIAAFSIYWFYFNEKSKYARTSVFSYPLEDTYYTNEFDSGLPYQLSEMVIDTTVPKGGTISDPLCGSAKVGVVAKRMNRDFIGIDINPETVNLCKIRLGLD